MKSKAKNTDEYLAGLPDWQKLNLENFRNAIHTAIPGIKEDIKWGVPVFVSKSKTLFAMSAFKEHTKYNFLLNGALIDDPANLFNNGFESKKSRAIDLQEGQTINMIKFKQLIEKAYKNLK